MVTATLHCKHVCEHVLVCLKASFCKLGTHMSVYVHVHVLSGHSSLEVHFCATVDDSARKVWTSYCIHNHQLR